MRVTSRSPAPAPTTHRNVASEGQVAQCLVRVRVGVGVGFRVSVRAMVGNLH